MTEGILFDLIKLSPAFGVLAWFVWYLIQRNEQKDERVNIMHKEVVDLVADVKNEMRELVKTQQKDLLEVIHLTHTALSNNTVALQNLTHHIEKGQKDEKVQK